MVIKIAVLNPWETSTLQRVYLHSKEYQKTNRIDYIFTHKLWRPSFIISYNTETENIYLKAKCSREENKEDFFILSPNSTNLYYWIKQIYEEEFYVFH